MAQACALGAGNIFDRRIPQKFHSFGHCVVILGAERLHIVDCAVIDYCHFRRSHAYRGARRINGGIAASDHKYLVAFVYYHLFAVYIAVLKQAYTSQKPYGLTYTAMIYAGDVKFFRLSGAGTYEYGVEAFGEKVVDRKVAAYGGVKVECHPEVLYFLYFAAHHLFGQAVFRYAEHQYSARLRLHLENLYGKSLSRQVAGDCKAGRTAADDRYAPP